MGEEMLLLSRPPRAVDVACPPLHRAPRPVLCPLVGREQAMACGRPLSKWRIARLIKQQARAPTEDSNNLSLVRRANNPLVCFSCAY